MNQQESTVAASMGFKVHTSKYKTRLEGKYNKEGHLVVVLEMFERQHDIPLGTIRFSTQLSGYSCLGQAMITYSFYLLSGYSPISRLLAKLLNEVVKRIQFGTEIRTLLLFGLMYVHIFCLKV